MNISSHTSVKKVDQYVSKCLANRAMKHARKQVGLSLTELLISMALGVTLMAGVVEVFVSMRQTDRSQEAISRMQEAGRFAFNFLSAEIRSSGYIGCSSTMNPALINNNLRPGSTPASFQPGQGIQGWEANGTDPGDEITSTANVAVVSSNNGNWGTTGGNVLDVTSVVPQSDIIRVWGVDSGRNSEGNLLTVSPSVRVSDMDIDDGDILVISDCQFADLIQPCDVTAVAGPPITHTLTLNASCTPGNIPSPSIISAIGADVIKLSGITYYIGKRGNVATNPPALFRRPLGSNGSAGTAEELVEGIENMQILYGENINNDSTDSADRYVPADQVTNWQNVVSVRINILVQSIEDNLTPAPQAYTFNGVNYNGESGQGDLPPDGKLRRVFSTTISLRNRTLGG